MQSKEAKNLSKRVTRNIGELAMAFKDKGAPDKRKATNKDECYNYHKFGHFGRDCFLPNRRLNKTTQQLQSRRRRRESRRNRAQCRDRSGGQSDTPYQAYQTSKNKTRYENNSDSKPFAPRPVKTAFMVKEQRDNLGLQRPF